MKRFTFITIISLLIPLLGIGQSKNRYVDDVYLKPSKAKSLQLDQDKNVQPSQESQQNRDNQLSRRTKPAPTYKNGAREIIFKDREDGNSARVKHDTVFVVGEANDSTENNQDRGQYSNGSNGSETDMEYAERIKHFHNPEIIIADPLYLDYNYMNDYGWNPYGYGNWGYGFGNWGGFNSFYSPFYSPWGFDGFYGGFGYGGYYGYGGYGYGFGGYGDYGYGNYGNNWYGHSNGFDKTHDEGTRREVSNNTVGSRAGNIPSSSQTMVGGGGYSSSSNPYTVVGGTGSRAVTSKVNGNTSGMRTVNPSNFTSRTVSTNRGIGVVRTGEARNYSGMNQTSINGNSGSRTSATYTINTTPRTTTRNSSTSVITSNARNVNPTNSNSYSSGSRSSSPSPVYNNSSRSSSYSSGNSSYSSGNSGVSSRSSGSSYSGGSSSGASSGGSRSSSGGGSGGRR